MLCELQHARLPCPSPSPRVCSNSCPLSKDAIQPPHPLSSPSPPAFNLSQHWVFSNKSVLRIRWPKYWSFSISPSDEYSELIYFRINSSLRDAQESSPASQFKSINSLVLSLLYSPTLHNPNDYCKNHSFMWTFIGKVMSLLFNTRSRFVIAFLLRIKHLWISWLQSLSTVIESQECI